MLKDLKNNSKGVEYLCKKYNLGKLEIDSLKKKFLKLSNKKSELTKEDYIKSLGLMGI